MSEVNPRIGDVIGDKYRIERKLGGGGMGTVFSATHLMTGRRFALKWMNSRATHDTAARERFIREFQAAGCIDHPNVVAVLDVGERDGALYIVMEYLEGESLAAKIARRPLAPAECVPILVEAMRGVAAAHRRDIVHRDLKPDNIFICESGGRNGPDVKVLDFGVAKGVNSRADQMPTITARGMAVGTPPYMAPEQVLALPSMDHRVDIYAFGVILYEALSGRLPFSGVSGMLLLERIVRGGPLPLSQVMGGVPIGLEATVMRALSRDPRRRFAQLADFAACLQPWAAEDVGRFGDTLSSPLRDSVLEEPPAQGGMFSAWREFTKSVRASVPAWERARVQNPPEQRAHAAPGSGERMESPPAAPNAGERQASGASHVAARTPDPRDSGETTSRASRAFYAVRVESSASETEWRGAETSTSASEAEQRDSETSTSASEAEQRDSETSTSASEAEQRASGTSTSASEAEQRASGTSTSASAQANGRGVSDASRTPDASAAVVHPPSAQEAGRSASRDGNGRKTKKHRRRARARRDNTDPRRQDVSATSDTPGTNAAAVHPAAAGEVQVPANRDADAPQTRTAESRAEIASNASRIPGASDAMLSTGADAVGMGSSGKSDRAQSYSADPTHPTFDSSEAMLGPASSASPAVASPGFALETELEAEHRSLISETADANIRTSSAPHVEHSEEASPHALDALAQHTAEADIARSAGNTAEASASQPEAPNSLAVSMPESSSANTSTGARDRGTSHPAGSQTPQPTAAEVGRPSERRGSSTSVRGPARTPDVSSIETALRKALAREGRLSRPDRDAPAPDASGRDSFADLTAAGDTSAENNAAPRELQSEVPALAHYTHALAPSGRASSPDPLGHPEFTWDPDAFARELRALEVTRPSAVDSEQARPRRPRTNTLTTLPFARLPDVPPPASERAPRRRVPTLRPQSAVPLMATFQRITPAAPRPSEAGAPPSHVLPSAARMSMHELSPVAADSTHDIWSIPTEMSMPVPRQPVIRSGGPFPWIVLAAAVACSAGLILWMEANDDAQDASSAESEAPADIFADPPPESTTVAPSPQVGQPQPADAARVPAVDVPPAAVEAAKTVSQLELPSSIGPRANPSIAALEPETAFAAPESTAPKAQREGAAVESGAPRASGTEASESDLKVVSSPVMAAESRHAEPQVTRETRVDAQIVSPAPAPEATPRSSENTAVQGQPAARAATDRSRVESKITAAQTNAGAANDSAAEQPGASGASSGPATASARASAATVADSAPNVGSQTNNRVPGSEQRPSLAASRSSALVDLPTAPSGATSPAPELQPASVPAAVEKATAAGLAPPAKREFEAAASVGGSPALEIEARVASEPTSAQRVKSGAESIPTAAAGRDARAKLGQPPLAASEFVVLSAAPSGALDNVSASTPAPLATDATQANAAASPASPKANAANPAASVDDAKGNAAALRVDPPSDTAARAARAPAPAGHNANPSADASGGARPSAGLNAPPAAAKTPNNSKTANTPQKSPAKPVVPKNAATDDGSGIPTLIAMPITNKPAPRAAERGPATQAAEKPKSTASPGPKPAAAVSGESTSAPPRKTSGVSVKDF